jgi:diamine N-acetyltransferase
MSETTTDVPWSIRIARSTDAARLSPLAATLFRQGYGPTHPEPTMSRYVADAFAPARMAAILADPAANVLLVERGADDGIGYAQVRVGMPEAATTHLTDALPGRRGLEIVRFYVDAAWHGRGIAQALMRACDDVALQRGCDVIWLQAWQLAVRPLAFYRKAGFTIHGTAIFRFGERDDEDYILARRVAAGAVHATSGNA